MPPLVPEGDPKAERGRWPFSVRTGVLQCWGARPCLAVWWPAVVPETDAWAESLPHWNWGHCEILSQNTGGGVGGQPWGSC